MVVDEAAAVAPPRHLGPHAAKSPLHVVLGALLHDLGKGHDDRAARSRTGGAHRLPASRGCRRGSRARRAFTPDVRRRGRARGPRDRSLASFPGSLFYALERGELDERSYANAVRKVLKRIHPVRWQALVAACEGDWRGRAIEGVGSMRFDPGLRFAEADRGAQLDVAPATPLIQGRDVLGARVAPGPRSVGCCARSKQARDRGRDRGVATEALALLRPLVARN